MERIARVVAAFALLLVLCGILVVPGAFAVVEVEPFSSPRLEARFRHLTQELRCPKCQNQNLADSGSPISADLRREIRELLEQGSTDAEITDYLVSRYGDFVLYRPPLQQNTWMLWLGPVALLLIALATGFAVVRHQRRTPAGGSPDNELSEQEQQQLAKLFDTPAEVNVAPGDERIS